MKATIYFKKRNPLTKKRKKKLQLTLKIEVKSKKIKPKPTDLKTTLIGGKKQKHIYKKITPKKKKKKHVTITRTVERGSFGVSSKPLFSLIFSLKTSQNWSDGILVGSSRKPLVPIKIPSPSQLNTPPTHFLSFLSILSISPPTKHSLRFFLFYSFVVLKKLYHLPCH